MSVRSRNVPRASRTAAMKQPPCDGRRSSHRAALDRSASHVAAAVVVVVPERREIRVEFLPGGPLDEPARDESGRGGDLAAHDVPVQALDAVGGVESTAVAAGRRRAVGRDDADAPAGRDRDGLVRTEHVERHPSSGPARPFGSASAVPTKRAKGEVPSSTSFRRM